MDGVYSSYIFLVFFLLTNPTSCGLHSHPKTLPAVARDAVQHSTRVSSPVAYASPVIPTSSDPVFQPPAILSAGFAVFVQSIVEHSSGMKSNVCDSVTDRINPIASLSQDLRQHNCLFFPRCTTSRGKSFCDNFPRRSKLSLGHHCVAKLQRIVWDPNFLYLVQYYLITCILVRMSSSSLSIIYMMDLLWSVADLLARISSSTLSCTVPRAQSTRSTLSTTVFNLDRHLWLCMQLIVT